MQKVIVCLCLLLPFYLYDTKSITVVLTVFLADDLKHNLHAQIRMSHIAEGLSCMSVWCIGDAVSG